MSLKDVDTKDFPSDFEVWLKNLINNSYYLDRKKSLTFTLPTCPANSVTQVLVSMEGIHKDDFISVSCTSGVPANITLGNVAVTNNNTALLDFINPTGGGIGGGTITADVFIVHGH